MGTNVPDDNIIAVHAGGKHSMILTDSGNLYSWGFGAIGQLGHGSAKNISKPVVIKKFTEAKIIKLALGSNHSLSLSLDGKVFSCGSSEFG